MKKKIPVLLFFLMLTFTISSQDTSRYKKIYIDLKTPGSDVSIWTTFYAFNDVEEGDRLCRELFNFTTLPRIISEDNFVPLTWIDPASGLTGYSYAVMKNGFEIWIFKNTGDGRLRGKGFYSYKVGERSE